MYRREYHMNAVEADRARVAEEAGRMVPRHPTLRELVEPTREERLNPPWAYAGKGRWHPEAEPVGAPPNYGNRGETRYAVGVESVHGEPALPKSAADVLEQVQKPRVGAFEILTRAAEIVSGDRATTHGPKERNHQNIADHWNAYLSGRLDKPLTALDAALMMAELKIARAKFAGYNPDDYVDGAGYFGVAGEIAANGREV